MSYTEELAKVNGYNYAKAKAAGFTDADIAKELETPRPALTSPPPQVQTTAPQQGLSSTPQPGLLASTGRVASDIAKSATSGALKVPGAITGLLDIPSALTLGTTPVSDLADKIGTATGMQPSVLSKEYSDSRSPEQAKSTEDISAVWAKKAPPLKKAVDLAKAYITRPAYTANIVAESLPMTLAGGLASRAAMTPSLISKVGLGNAAAVTGAIGEGLVQTGSAMDEYEGVDYRKAAIAAVGSGAADALIAGAAGKLAQSLGFETTGTLMAKGFNRTGSKDVVGNIIKGGANEALLQEMPQSAVEQVYSNYANNKPILEGVPRASVEGALAGGVMGGASNVSTWTNPTAELKEDPLLPIRKANLSSSDLVTLRNSPEVLATRGLKPEYIDALIQENTAQAAEVARFQGVIDSAPSEVIRKSLLNTLQGQVFQKLSNYAGSSEVDAQGNTQQARDTMDAAVKANTAVPRSELRKRAQEEFNQVSAIIKEPTIQETSEDIAKFKALKELNKDLSTEALAQYYDVPVQVDDNVAAKAPVESVAPTESVAPAESMVAQEEAPTSELAQPTEEPSVEPPRTPEDAKARASEIYETLLSDALLTEAQETALREEYKGLLSSLQTEQDAVVPEVPQSEEALAPEGLQTEEAIVEESTSGLEEPTTQTEEPIESVQLDRAQSEIASSTNTQPIISEQPGAPIQFEKNEEQKQATVDELTKRFSSYPTDTLYSLMNTATETGNTVAYKALSDIVLRRPDGINETSETEAPNSNAETVRSSAQPAGENKADGGGYTGNPGVVQPQAGTETQGLTPAEQAPAEPAPKSVKDPVKQAELLQEVTRLQDSLDGLQYAVTRAKGKEAKAEAKGKLHETETKIEALMQDPHYSLDSTINVPGAKGEGEPLTATSAYEILVQAVEGKKGVLQSVAKVLLDNVPAAKLKATEVVPGSFGSRYSPRADLIFIHYNSLRNRIHEVVHAITAREMNANTILREKVGELLDTFSVHAVKEGLISIEDATRAKTLSFKEFQELALTIEPNLAELMYAMRNEDEFLAQALSNKYVQGILKGIAVKPTKTSFGRTIKSAWDALVNTISNVIGLQSEHEWNALQEVLAITIESSKLAVELKDGKIYADLGSEEAQYHNSLEARPSGTLDTLGPAIESDSSEAAKAILDKIFNAPSATTKALTNEIANDPKLKNGVELTGRMLGFTRDKDNQNTSWFTRIFSSPEFYFKITKASRAMFEAAQANSVRKVELSHSTFKDFHKVTTAIQKSNPKAYKEGNAYVLKTDETGISFGIRTQDNVWYVTDRVGDNIKSFDTEAEAISGLEQAEQNYLDRAGMSKDAKAVVLALRQATNRGFDHMVASMRAQIASDKANKVDESTAIFINDEGKEVVVALSELINQVNDLRGSYFPRERISRQYHLTATQEGKPNIMQTFNVYLPHNTERGKLTESIKEVINNNAPIGRFHKDLVAKGYDPKNISINSMGSPLGQIFDFMGMTTSLDAILSEAAKNVTEDSADEVEKKFVMAVNQAMSMRIADLYKAKGSMSSKMHRSDKYWEGFESDLIKAVTGYTNRLTTGIATRETARRMLEAFTGRAESWVDYKARLISEGVSNKNIKHSKYIAQVKRERISPTNQDKLYEDGRLFMKTFLSPADDIERAIGVMKSATVLMYLGGRVMTSAVNSLTMFTTVVASIVSHTGQGLIQTSKDLTSAATSWKEHRLQAMYDEGHTTLGKKTAFISKSNKAILDAIYERGHADPKFNMDAARAMSGRIGNIHNQVMEKAMYMFGKTESMNRAVTILAAYNAYARKAGYSGENVSEAILKLALQTSDAAHGVYGKAAKPWAVQKLPMLDLPYTFMKYQHTFYMNLAEMVRKGDVKAATYMLLAPQVLAGTSLVSVVGSMIAKALGSDDPEEEYAKALTEMSGAKYGDQGFVERFAKGGASAVIGLNIKGSMEPKIGIPKEVIDLGGAPVNVLVDAIDSLISLSKGEYSKALEKGLPSALRGPIKGYREMTEGVTTNQYAPVIEKGVPVKATGFELAQRVIGANPYRTSDIRNTQWKADEVRRKYTEKRSAIGEEYNRLLVQGVPAEDTKWEAFRAKIDKYNEKAKNADNKYLIPRIDSKWLKSSRDRSFKPSKYEK